MAFEWFVIIFGWLSIFLFIVLTVCKFFGFSAMPLNLRWEVYPVPHETKERRYYGGSYMEQVDWVKKPRHSSRAAELIEMASEIFLLKRVREHNPYHLWPWSLAMHWGTYLLLLWMVLLASSKAFPMLSGPAGIIGVTAFVLGLVGTVGLIVKRAITRDLALYTAPVDYFNLVFLLAIFGLGLVSWLADAGFSQHQAYLTSLFAFRPVSVSLTVVAMFFLLEAFAIYMPFSKLIHYIIKHFTFTETLWDDAFSVKGSRKDKRIEKQLAYEINWAGPHIEPGKTWLEDVQMSSAGEEERQ